MSEGALHASIYNANSFRPTVEQDSPFAPYCVMSYMIILFTSLHRVFRQGNDKLFARGSAQSLSDIFYGSLVGKPT